MDRQQWYDERDDRTLRYAARRLDHHRWIAITADPTYLRRFDGQVAVLTGCNLLGRMTPSVALCFEDVPVHDALPSAGRSLHEVLLTQMRASDPYGEFAVRAANDADYRLHLGARGAPHVVHGAGWNAYVGPGPSPIVEQDELNCFGAAFAAILAASQIFNHAFAPLAQPFACNTLNWRNEISPDAIPSPVSFGDIWTIGAGSVGTAALYFLSLASRDFSALLIDHDKVKRHNLDRSPIFIASDVGDPKVDAVERYLKDAGVREVRSDAHALHESDLWLNREAGRPDVVIAAANEMKVRYFIEAGYPPLQLYGTTGKNYQAAGVRHDPFGNACSLCLFPQDAAPGATDCATAPPEHSPSDAEPQVDAALPFLSFTAGLMAAAETAKRLLPGYPFNANRVILNTRPAPQLVSAPLAHRDGCYCETRDRNIHRLMLANAHTAAEA